MAKANIKITGLKELQKKLRTSDPIYADPFNRAMEAIAEEASTRVRAAAPVRTGKLRSSVRPRVTRAPIIKYAAVDVTAKRDRGRGDRRYPNILEFGANSKHKGKLTRAAESTSLESHLGKAANAIEGLWGR